MHVLCCFLVVIFIGKAEYPRYSVVLTLEYNFLTLLYKNAYNYQLFRFNLLWNTLF